jgi:hypothetical protein
MIFARFLTAIVSDDRGIIFGYVEAAIRLGERRCNTPRRDNCLK